MSGRNKNNKKKSLEQKKNDEVVAGQGAAASQSSPLDDQGSPRGSIIPPSPRLRTPVDESSDESAVYRSVRKTIGLDLSGSSHDRSGLEEGSQGAGASGNAGAGASGSPEPKRRKLVSISK